MNSCWFMCECDHNMSQNLLLEILLGDILVIVLCVCVCVLHSTLKVFLIISFAAKNFLNFCLVQNEEMCSKTTILFLMSALFVDEGGMESATARGFIISGVLCNS